MRFPERESRGRDSCKVGVNLVPISQIRRLFEGKDALLAEGSLPRRRFGIAPVSVGHSSIWPPGMPPRRRSSKGWGPG